MKLTEAEIEKYIFVHYDEGYGNNVKGTYVPYRVFQLIALWTDIEHKFAILELLEAINEKAIAMHRSAYEEMKNEIARLTRERDEAIKRDEESNRGFDHHRAGTILLQLLAERSRRGVTHPPNCYTMKIRETEVIPDAHPHEIIIPNIFNIDRMKTLIYFYAKNCELESVSIYKTKLIIPNIDAFKDFVYSLQHFAFDPPYNIDSIIERYTTEHKTYSPKYIGEMFELYCSKRFNLRWYKLDRTEKLALLKYDRGIDLISIDDRIIAQCKHYNTTLELDRLATFRDCCNAFEGWTHLLIVNSSAKIAPEVISLKCWTIRRVPDNEFEEFLNPYIKAAETKSTNDLASETKPTSKELNFKNLCFQHSKEIKNQIHDFISSKLDEGSMTVNAAIDLVNSTFTLDVPINERKLFMICHDLYQRTNQGALPTNSKGERLLIRAVSHEAQAQFIISTISNGEYIRDEFVKLFNSHFSTSYNSKSFVKRFSRLFVGRGRTNTLPTRTIEGTEISMLELKHVPHRAQDFKNFIIANQDLTKDELIKSFNSHFHRYESTRSWNKLIESLS